MTATVSLTEKNRAIVLELYAAAASGQPERIMGLLTDDIVVDEPSYLPYGKVYNGIEEFAGLFGMIGDYLDLSDIRVNYTIADGDRVAACVSVRDVTSGEYTTFIEQSTVRDGKIAEIRLFYYDPQTMLDKPKVV